MTRTPWPPRAGPRRRSRSCRWATRTPASSRARQASPSRASRRRTRSRWACGSRTSGRGTGCSRSKRAVTRSSPTPSTSRSARASAWTIPAAPPLRAVAIDGAGNGGTQLDTVLCIENRIPDNGHACDPTQAVPAVVFSLRWDANFDVDLHVITPDGTDIEPSDQPARLPGRRRAAARERPLIDRDSPRPACPRRSSPGGPRLPGLPGHRPLRHLRGPVRGVRPGLRPLRAHDLRGAERREPPADVHAGRRAARERHHRGGLVRPLRRGEGLQLKQRSTP